MIKLYDEGVYLVNGDAIVKESESEKVEKLTGKKVERRGQAHRVDDLERTLGGAGAVRPGDVDALWARVGDAGAPGAGARGHGLDGLLS